MDEAITRIKEHLKLTHVRLALANNCTLNSEISSVGVCAGSGASVLAGVKADLILTGEMSHHEILDFVHRQVRESTTAVYSVSVNIGMMKCAVSLVQLHIWSCTGPTLVLPRQAENSWFGRVRDGVPLSLWGATGHS